MFLGFFLYFSDVLAAIKGSGKKWNNSNCIFIS